jgi:branched-subunit amino acid aminotransferase/4-amino-4-deoxychorismate lyase
MKFNLKNLDFVWLNGEFQRVEDSNISVLTHSLHYGGAAFEGIRAYNGRVFKLVEHLLRLFHSNWKAERTLTSSLWT